MTAERMRRTEKLENAAFVAFLVAIIVLFDSTPEGKMLIQQLVKITGYSGAVYIGVRSWFP
jgi:hypothetical protein